MEPAPVSAPDWIPGWISFSSEESGGENSRKQLENLTISSDVSSDSIQLTENVETSVTREQRLEQAAFPKQSKRKQNKRQPKEDRKLTKKVQEFAAQHPVCQHVPLFFWEFGIAQPVDEVAKGLLGQYLFIEQSNLVIRILETEAYLEYEELSRAMFQQDSPKFKIAAGTLLAWASPSFNNGNPQLFLTVGDNSCGDVVLLRSCETKYGHWAIRSRLDITGPINQQTKSNLLLGPENVSKALFPDLTSNCNVLDATGEIRLLEKESTGESIMQGKRILPMDTSALTYSKLSGIDKEYRFALFSTRMKYKDRTDLHRSGDVLQATGSSSTEHDLAPPGTE